MIFTNKSLPYAILIREANAMNILKQSLELIALMESEKIPVREFILKHHEYFSDIPTSSLIAPECRNICECRESGYIFLIGSYFYFRTENMLVTWFQRRRFAEFNRYEKLYKKTISTGISRRFQSLEELKIYLEYLQEENYEDCID